MNQEPIIRIEGVEKIYDMGEVKVHALRGVNLEVLPGDFVAIMGPSGSGKSTLLNLLGCLDRPSAGRFFLGGEDVSEMDDHELSEVRGRKIGFIFQSYNLIHQLSLINIQIRSSSRLTRRRTTNAARFRGLVWDPIMLTSFRG